MLHMDRPCSGLGPRHNKKVTAQYSNSIHLILLKTAHPYSHVTARCTYPFCKYKIQTPVLQESVVDNATDILPNTVI